MTRHASSPGARRAIAALVGVAAVHAGCSVSVSLEGKGCPCLDGYICDELRDRCVPRTCEPAVTVGELTADWVTAHQSRLTWQVEGSGEQLARYELLVAETKTDIATRSGTVRIYDSATNPELGYRTRPFVGGEVDATTAHGLAPATSYVAQLRAIDSALCEAASSVVTFTTSPEPAGSIAIYRDALRPGAELFPYTDAFQEVTEGGETYIHYAALEDDECVPEESNIEDVQAICGQPLRLRLLDLPLSREPGQPASNGVRDNAFGTAFLEFRVADLAPTHSWYSLVWLRFDDCGGGEATYEWDGWTFRADGDYVTIQVPLSELRNEAGEALTFADIDVQAGGTPLCSFGLSGSWHKTAEVRLDDIVVRY